MLEWEGGLLIDIQKFKHAVYNGEQETKIVRQLKSADASSKQFLHNCIAVQKGASPKIVKQNTNLFVFQHPTRSCNQLGPYAQRKQHRIIVNEQIYENTF